MKVYILWGTLHSTKTELFCGVYREKEECLSELKHQQELISVESIEFHVQETELK